MKITNLTSSSSSAAGYTFQPGDVKITTNSYEQGFFNLNNQSYLKRKSSSNITQNLPGPCFDLVPFSDFQMTNDEVDNGYAFKLNNNDFITFTQRIAGFGNRLIKINYYNSTTKNISDSKTFEVSDSQIFFDAVCDYENNIYIYKNNSKSVNTEKYNIIKKITFDLNNKTLSEFSEIITQDRRITQVIFDRINNKYISYEHNKIITDLNNDNSGIFIDVDFENINNISLSVPYFSISKLDSFLEHSFLDDNEITEQDIDNQIFNFNSRLYYSKDNSLFFYNKISSNIDNINNVNELNELYTIDLIELKDEDNSKIKFQQIESITEAFNNIIVNYRCNTIVDNNTFPYNSFVKYNKFNQLMNYIHLYKFTEGNHIIIKQVFDTNVYNFDIGILYSYLDYNTSSFKRDVGSFLGAVITDVNKLNSNYIQNLGNFTINKSQIFNGEDFYIIDNIGAVEFKDLKIKKISYEPFIFPYIFVSQITDAPKGINYLMKE